MALPYSCYSRMQIYNPTPPTADFRNKNHEINFSRRKKYSTKTIKLSIIFAVKNLVTVLYAEKLNATTDLF